MKLRLTRLATVAALAVLPAACAAPGFNRPVGEAHVDPRLGAATASNLAAHAHRAGPDRQRLDGKYARIVYRQYVASAQ